MVLFILESEFLYYTILIFFHVNTSQVYSLMLLSAYVVMVAFRYKLLATQLISMIILNKVQHIQL